MRTRRRWIALLGTGLAFAPLAGFGQAIAVSPSGTMTQEQTTPTIAPEDRASKEQLAQLFEVMRIQGQMQSMRKIIPTLIETEVRAQMHAMTEQVAPNAKLTADQRAQVDQLMHKYIDKAMNLYPVDEMLSDMTGLYQEYLSREDVSAMISFYQSPAGQHLLDAQPKIAHEYMPMVLQRTRERTQTLTAEMMKDLAVLKQSTNQTPSANK
ncbi:MAG: DUF2059 domain-containing protein [Terracidiphilus sp.]